VRWAVSVTPLHGQNRRSLTGVTFVVLGASHVKLVSNYDNSSRLSAYLSRYSRPKPPLIPTRIVATY
jgi:hypothetical protein